MSEFENNAEINSNESVEVVKNKQLFDFDKTIARFIFEKNVYPWQVLDNLGEFILQLGKTLDSSKYDEISENVWVHKTAKIADTASITGPVIIDENAEVRHCAFIRGNTIIGKNAVLGNSCEIKNSVMFDNAQCPHFNYIGDSIIGAGSHLGAGAVTSNLKSDRSIVVIKHDNKEISTNRKKVGAILGDKVEVGCGSVLNPGSIIGSNTNIYPLSMIRGYVDKNVIYKSKDQIVSKN